jgi:DNA-binding transcriptional ArsR family regulator
VAAVAHPEHVNQWAERFAVLGDPSRLRLLLLIHRRGPISVSALSDASGLKPTTVSHALRLLRIAGMVDTTRDGHSRLYRLVDPITAGLLGSVEDAGRATALLNEDP